MPQQQQIRKKRSLNQNDYYKGILLPMVVKFFHDSACPLSETQVDYVIKHGVDSMCDMSMPNGEIVKVPRSTTTMNTAEFALFVEKIIAWASMRYDLMLPFPNEVL